MSKHPKISHNIYTYGDESEVITFGLTNEQRKAVEESVLPPMPTEGFWIGSDGVRLSVSGGLASGDICVTVGGRSFNSDASFVRRIATKITEFADAIEARS